MTETPENLTQLLLKASQGNRRALDEILPIVYNGLRHIAQNYLNQERDDHTLRATAFVHEAYLKIYNKTTQITRKRFNRIGQKTFENRKR